MGICTPVRGAFEQWALPDSPAERRGVHTTAATQWQRQELRNVATFYEPRASQHPDLAPQKMRRVKMRPKTYLNPHAFAEQ